MFELYKIYKSNRDGKKYMINIVNPMTKNVNRIYFGDSRYEDYTIHKNRKRRESYRLRHARDKIDDYTKPGFWSFHILWGKYTDINKNLRWTINTFNLY
jgi:hypothetical protein